MKFHKIHRKTPVPGLFKKTFFVEHVCTTASETSQHLISSIHIWNRICAFTPKNVFKKRSLALMSFLASFSQKAWAPFLYLHFSRITVFKLTENYSPLKWCKPSSGQRPLRKKSIYCSSCAKPTFSISSQFVTIPCSMGYFNVKIPRLLWASSPT